MLIEQNSATSQLCMQIKCLCAMANIALNARLWVGGRRRAGILHSNMLALQPSQRQRSWDASNVFVKRGLVRPSAKPHASHHGHQIPGLTSVNASVLWLPNFKPDRADLLRESNEIQHPQRLKKAHAAKHIPLG
eukprot:6180523-Pleurochrysis_carterae.AAC.1